MSFKVSLLSIIVYTGTLFFSQFSFSNVVGNGHQNFNTITDGLDFVSVYSSETLEPGIINLGLFMNQAVNSLPYFEDSTQGRTNFNDTLLGADLNIGLGLSKNWEVGLSAPFVLRQKIDAENQSHGEFTQLGNTELRAMTKYRLLGDQASGFAFIFSINIDQTRNNPYAGNNPGPTTNYEIAMDRTIAKWALGLNLGYRKAQPGDPIAGFPMEPNGNQYIASTAASYLLEKVDTKLIFEIFGSLPAERKSSNADRSNSSLELLAGVKHNYNHQIALHFGGGTELVHGASSPDWRAYAGINYTFGSVFKSGSPLLESELTSTGARKFVSHHIQFEFDSNQMTASSQEVIDLIKKELESIRYKSLVIVGYTDSIGNDEYNLNLSLSRAQTIRKHLLRQLKISDDRVKAIGKGEQNPIGDNGNFQGRQLNRRVEFLIE